jgi:hypothetical protein
MKMRLRLLCLSLLLTALMVNSTGCLLVAAGAGAAGTVAYMQGDLETSEPYDIATVYAATKKAAEDLKLYVVEGECGQDALSATVVVRDAADKRITVKLKSVTEKSTRISVRVGTFGDDAKSQMVYNRIRENLKATAPQPAASAPSPTAQTSAPPGSATASLPAQDAPIPAAPQ